MAVYQAYEDLSVSTTAVGFTAATFGSNNKAFVTVEGTSVRYRVDRTDPTSTVGHFLDVGDSLKLEGHGELQNIKFISSTGATATLRCSFGV